MSRKIKAGLIGCGSLSLKGILPHLSEPDAREKVELVAVCDTVEERARQTAARFSIPHYYADAGELIDRSDVELVLIATPISHHYACAMRALRAGKHVYVQKTIATTFSEARDLVATAHEHGLTLVAAPGQMLAPTMQKLKELIERGVLGKVYWAWASTPGWSHESEPTRQGDDALYSTDPSWYYQNGGGPLADVAVYALHSLTGVLGPARMVAAMSGTGLAERRWRDKVIPVEVDDNALLMLDFGEATFALAGANACMTGRLFEFGSMGVYGSEGTVETLEIDQLSGKPVKLRVESRRLPESSEFPDGIYTAPGALPHVLGAHTAIPEPHVYADIMHCVECVLDGRAPIASGNHAAHVIEIIEKSYLAARTGQTQELESVF